MMPGTQFLTPTVHCPGCGELIDADAIAAEHEVTTDDTRAELYDILDEFRRVFWKNMSLTTATTWARALEPYNGAYLVVASSDVPHGEKAAMV